MGWDDSSDEWNRQNRWRLENVVEKWQSISIIELIIIIILIVIIIVMVV